MASMKNLKRGQKLYKVTKSKMGNTTMQTCSISEIEVQEVHADQGFIFYKGRNGNTMRMNETHLKAWKVKKPVLRELFTGQFVVDTRPSGSDLLTSALIDAGKK